jgi:hypothetical protein
MLDSKQLQVLLDDLSLTTKTFPSHPQSCVCVHTLIHSSSMIYEQPCQDSLGPGPLPKGPLGFPMRSRITSELVIKLCVCYG